MDKIKNIDPLHGRFGYLSLSMYGIVLLLLGVLIRSDFFINIVSLVLKIIGWASVAGGAGIAIVGVVAFGYERGWWDKIMERTGGDAGQADSKMQYVRGLSSSALFIITLLFFFLPWVSVFVPVSAIQMMGIIESDIIGEPDIGQGLSDAPLLYVMAALSIIGAALFFLPQKMGGYIRAGIAGVSILFIALFVVIATEEILGFAYGLWLTTLGYIAVVIIQFVPLPFAESSGESAG